MIEKLKKDIVQAMKAKDTGKLSTLRLLMSALENKRVELKLKDVSEISNDSFYESVRKNLKTVHQQIDSLKSAKRDYTAQLNEKALLETYLPQQLTEEEILKYINNEITNFKLDNGKDIEDPRKLMGILSKKLKNKADMSVVSKMLAKANK